MWETSNQRVPKILNAVSRKFPDKVESSKKQKIRVQVLHIEQVCMVLYRCLWRTFKVKSRGQGPNAQKS